MIQNKINKFFEDMVEKTRFSPLLYRFAQGSFWGIVSTMVTRVFQMITSIIIARLLGAEKFGAYGMVQSSLLLFGFLAGFSMGGTLTKYIAQYKNSDKIKAGNILNLTNFLSLLTAASIMTIIIVISPWLAKRTFHRDEMESLMCTGAVLLFISAINDVKTGAIAGFENFKEIAKVNSFQAIATPVLAIPLVYYIGIQGAIVSLIISTTISYGITSKILKSECKKHGIIYKIYDRSSFKELPIIWNYSMPSVISALCIIPAIWISNAILINQKNGYAELGIFNAANQWRQLILFFPQVLTSVSLPILSETHSRESKEDFINAFKINIRLTWSIALPMTIFVIAFRNIISGFFGSQFEGMASIILILMITAFTSIVTSIIGTTLLSTGRLKILIFFNIIWGATIVVAVNILAPLYGGVGMAVSYFIATLIMAGGEIIYSEWKIAPSAFAGEVLLIIISVCTITFVSVFYYYNYLSLPVGAAMLLFSLIPLLGSGYKYFYAREITN
jgi:O-antigen/teichoic acid export membrane protein